MGRTPRRVLTEASGSLTSAYVLKMIRAAGHTAIASDLDNFHAGRELADLCITLPKATDPDLWNITEKAIIEHDIDTVIPSLDETLLGWSERIPSFKEKGVEVLISPPETLSIFQDLFLDT